VTFAALPKLGLRHSRRLERPTVGRGVTVE
jgi:hypothetical protein